MTPPRLHTYKSTQLLAKDMASRIDRLATRHLESNGSFHIVLAGGGTPRMLYTQLKDINTGWENWHVYFGDERCLSKGDPSRNDSMARAAWLDHVAVPENQIHAIPAENGALKGARIYDELLKLAPRFDLVLLGLGEDGHTASLFPGQVDTPTGFSAARPVYQAPKPPADRISMTPERLSNADQVWFLVTGQAKRAALAAWLYGDDIPASHILPEPGIDIFTDLEPGGLS